PYMKARCGYVENWSNFEEFESAQAADSICFLPLVREGSQRTQRHRCASTTKRSQQTQNRGAGARRGAAYRFLGIGIRPSRWACFLAALRARRMASAFSRFLRSEGFSYAL